VHYSQDSGDGHGMNHPYCFNNEVLQHECFNTNVTITTTNCYQNMKIILNERVQNLTFEASQASQLECSVVEWLLNMSSARINSETMNER
ncbi:unnamed protein product, partial [Didymodactylos carnosus]